MKGSRKRFDFDKRRQSGSSLRILGLNTGTSADGLDFVLAEFRKGALPRVLGYRSFPFKRELTKDIITCGEPGFNDGIRWMNLDSELGHIMGKMTKLYLAELEKSGLRADIIASHGQTVRHIPEKSLTLQVGNPAIIAAHTGLPVVADFRQADIAAGGQGAPLSPLLHEYLFRDKKIWRAVVNIGGISNVTILPPIGSRRMPIAADCGPGNMAIDGAMTVLYGKPFDLNGRIAKSGKYSNKIVARIMRRDYFKLPPPKSTGRELFGEDFVYLIFRLSRGLRKEDIISTITEITVRGITGFISKFAVPVEQILLCGGGAKNAYLKGRIAERLPSCTVESTASLGYHTDHIEALLWAYLAYHFVNGIPVTADNFTGASKAYIPGSLWLP